MLFKSRHTAWELTLIVYLYLLVDQFISHLKDLPPAAADLEIRSLVSASSSTNLLPASHENETEEEDERTLFITALTNCLRQKHDYELVQAWMTVFLRVHGGDIVSTGGQSSGGQSSGGQSGSNSQQTRLIDALREWRTEQEREAKRLASLTGYCAGVIGFLRTARG